MPTGPGEYPNTLLSGHTRHGKGPNRLHTNRKVQVKRKYNLPTPGVPLEDILVFGAKGSISDVKREASQYSNNSVSFPPDVVARVKDDLEKCFLGLCSDPVPFETVLDNFLTLSSSSGQPWKEVCGTKRELIDKHSREEILNALYQYEKDVIEGTEFPIHVWDCIPKYDKYKCEKLDNGRLRTIQSGDMFYLCLMIRWLAPSIKAIYANHPRFLVQFTPEEYTIRIAMGFKGWETFGLDATGMDRGVPSEVVAWTVDTLSSLTSTPENIVSLLSHTAVEGPFQFGDGEITDSRVGGNPSGIWITTIINCIFMDMILFTSAGRLGLEEGKTIMWSITGDDTIVGLLPPYHSHHRELGGLTMARQIAEQAGTFGLIFKLDTMVEGLYPSDLGCHAPYLGRMSVVAGDFLFSLFTEPRRNLGWYHTYPPEQTDMQRMLSWIGIRESVLPYVVAATLDHRIPVPRVVLEFLQRFDAETNTFKLLGLKMETLMTPEKCLKCCGAVCLSG